MRILYFTQGLPSEKELAEAERLGALLRNSLAWHEGDAFEPCDLVMGRPESVPPPYRDLIGAIKTVSRRKKNAADS